MNGKQLAHGPIKVVVVPDCEKENCPPFLTHKVTVGRPRARLPVPTERVLRDITQMVYKEHAAEEAGREERPGVFCRV